MAYVKKSQDSKLGAFILNELMKKLGSDLSIVPFVDRLEEAYQIIKSQPRIHEKYIENNFFMTFVKTTQLLVLPTDNKTMNDLINYSFVVLENKEDIFETYAAIKNAQEEERKAEFAKKKNVFGRLI